MFDYLSKQNIEHAQDDSGKLETSEEGTEANPADASVSVQDDVPALEHVGYDVESKNNVEGEGKIIPDTAAARDEISTDLVNSSPESFSDSETAKNQVDVLKCDEIKAVKLESFRDAVPVIESLDASGVRKSEEKAMDIESEKEIDEETQVIKPLDRNTSLDTIFSSNSGNQINKNTSPFLISGSLEGED